MAYGRKTLARIILAMAAVVALLGVAAGCTKESGMYQGGSDSAPGWR
jgi:hypothetical protein